MHTRQDTLLLGYICMVHAVSARLGTLTEWALPSRGTSTSRHYIISSHIGHTCLRPGFKDLLATNGNQLGFIALYTCFILLPQHKQSRLDLLLVKAMP